MFVRFVCSPTFCYKPTFCASNCQYSVSSKAVTISKNRLASSKKLLSTDCEIRVPFG
ncbi:hypothetical protein Hanom_Chr09g00823061 [Helianthus anomalus]